MSDVPLADPRFAEPQLAGAGSLTLAAVPAPRRPTAMLIARAFADAGYGLVHQATGIANAMRESSLDPSQITATAHEHSVGLFQLNMQGGLGSGHTEAELLDPGTNVRIILAEVGRHAEFRQAATLADAVAVFVNKVERPADAGIEIEKRLAIARTLLA